jgi:toxin ParE1/3/4
MAHEVALSERAQRQLQEIEDYLAERFYPRNAERFVRRLTKACHSLALAPHRGTKRDELRPGIRTIGFERRATIYFKVVEQHVFIIGVFYGGKLPHELG